jgi:hypothetical protein
MLIRRGRILGIRNDSGHYHPRNEHIAHALRALLTYGVSIASIKIFAYNGDFIACGPAFMAGNAESMLGKHVEVPPRRAGEPRPGYVNN